MDEQVQEKGWQFPIQVSRRSGIAMMFGEDNIQQSIRIILQTAPGERVMRPEFGCDLHSLVFSPNSPATAGLVDYQVRQALERWEPRIVVLQVNVHPGYGDSSVLLIDLEYRLRSTQEIRTMVYTFQRLPEER